MIIIDDFINLLVFTLPGIVAYFLIQCFGITPVQKHKGTELLCISAILCAPIAVIVVVTYNILSLCEDVVVSYEVQYLLSVTDFKILTNRLSFLFYYFIYSIILSYIVARCISKYFNKLLKIINKTREDNGYAPLSTESTVWKGTFQKNNAQLVKITSFGQDDDYVIGSIDKVSRDFEAQGLLIEQGTWKKFYEEHKEDMLVDEVFVCTASGIKIEIFNDEAIRSLTEETEETEERMA